jgi:hypothetical protein
MLNQALGELKFSLSGLSDSEKAQRIGGFLSADVLVKGTVSSDFVSVECTDVETLTDTPQTRAIVRYLSQAISARVWVENGTYVSPHKSTDLDSYPDDFTRGYAEMLAEADTIRFDASDMMPPVVGAGSFWRGMTEWTEGRDARAVFREIDESWPR